MPMLCLGCSDTENAYETDDPALPDIPEKEYAFSTVDYRRKLNGSYLEWSTEDSQETRTINGMNHFTSSSAYNRTAWGGRIRLQPSQIVGKEGFFRIANCEGRTYLLDPDNGAVILHGIQHVRPGKSPRHQSAFNNQFGGDIVLWSKETGDLIADNHINYISYGADYIETFPAVIRSNLLTPKTQKVAYAEVICLLRTFMWKMSERLGYAFEDGKYNRMVLLFEPTFPTFIDEWCREKCPLFAGDKHFIGYYIDNELPFASFHNYNPVQGIDITHFLNLPDRYRSAREYAQKFLASKGITPDEITDEIQEEFRGLVADYYYRLTTETLRRYDTEHLILGTRLHDWGKYNQKVVEACARHCDVVSINYYGRWQPEEEYLNNLKQWCGTKPFLISEFYTKADDAYDGKQKYENDEGGGWVVRSQKDRGRFHQNFCLRLLEARNCIGWVHFEYNDGYTDQGASNKGIVSLDYEPYSEFLSDMRQLNLSVHSLTDYYDNKNKE